MDPDQAFVPVFVAQDPADQKQAGQHDDVTVDDH